MQYQNTTRSFSSCALTCSAAALTCILCWDSILKELKIHFTSSQCPTSLASVWHPEKERGSLQCPEGEIKFPVSRQKGLYRKGCSNCSTCESLSPSPGNLPSSRIAQGISSSYLGTKSFRSSICWKQNLPSCVQSAQVQIRCCSQPSLLRYR